MDSQHRATSSTNVVSRNRYKLYKTVIDTQPPRPELTANTRRSVAPESPGSNIAPVAAAFTILCASPLRRQGPFKHMIAGLCRPEAESV